MKRNLFLLLAGIILASNLAIAKEYHVAKTGSDSNAGTAESPFKTISKAAAVLHSGDTVTVHAGVYREWVSPRNSGLNKASRIVYRAAPEEEVWIKGSEEVKEWKKVKGNVWKAVVPNSIFGDFNPFKEELFGDWLYDTPYPLHLGEVYLNGKSFYQAGSVESLTNPVASELSKNPEQSIYQWYAEVGENETTIWANFQQYDPNKELVEINARPACFFPKEQGVNYITVQGFKMSQAATQWAPPTAVQKGLLGPNWSKGWIIENNEISNSKCSGISLGKEYASGNNLWTLEKTIIGFNREIEAIFSAINLGWNKETIGSHLIQNNVIFDCEQTGICGHMGAAFSVIQNNHIYDIHTKRQFTGAEIGCIKLHAGIDVLVKGNYLDNGYRGIWVDWQAMGMRITGNTFINNDFYDIMIEVTHGPTLVDNNILLSKGAILDMAQGTAWVHNFIAGYITRTPIPVRYTPYHHPHSTAVMGLTSFLCGDDRFYNNIFATCPGSTDENKQIGLSAYDSHPAYRDGVYQEMNLKSRGSLQAAEFTLAMYVESNLYYDGVKPYAHEAYNITSSANVNPVIEKRGDQMVLKLNLDNSVNELKTKLRNTENLGVTFFSNSFYENPDASPLSIDTDYFGNLRNTDNPKAGPFENLMAGNQEFIIWQKK